MAKKQGTSKGCMEGQKAKEVALCDSYCIVLDDCFVDHREGDLVLGYQDKGKTN